MTTEWIIKKLEYKVSENGLTNVVHKIQWTIKGVDTINGIEYSAEVYGPVILSEPAIETFVPFEQVTKEMVISWIETVLGATQIAELEARLSQIIQEKAAPSVVTIVNPFN